MADKIRSVNNYGPDKFAGVEGEATDRTAIIRERLEQAEKETNNNNFGDEYEWQPVFSRIQVRVTDKFANQKKTESGLYIIESKAKLPYIEVEVVAVGNNAGWNEEHTQHIEEFKVGDILKVFEKQIEFNYLDGKGHNEFYEPGRPYIAHIKDIFAIAKRGKKRNETNS